MRRSGSIRGSGLYGMKLDINGKSVSVQEKIGDGGYGAIYKCLDSSREMRVVKILTAQDPERMAAIQREVDFQKLFSESTHIVHLLGTTVTSVGQFLILLEYCETNLVEEMNRYFGTGFSSQYIATVFASILHAVIDIHDKGLIHRDLKPENVLSRSGVWKLCDFGSCTTTVYDMNGADDRTMAAARDDIDRNTTPCYRAPEMIDFYRGQVIGQKSDIWALGCLLFKMCTFKDAFPDAAKLQILNGKYDWKCCSWEVDDAFKELVAMCFRNDPTERPTAKDLLRELEARFKLGDLTQPFSELLWSSSQSRDTLSRSESESLSTQASTPASAAASARATGRVPAPSSAAASARSSVAKKVSTPAMRSSGIKGPLVKSPIEQYTEIMLMMKPIAADVLSDESDIEMDEEHVVVRDPSVQDIRKEDDEEFEFEDDVPYTDDKKSAAVIDVPVTIETLIDLSTDSPGAGQTPAFNLFDALYQPPSYENSGGDDDLLNFDLLPAPKGEAVPKKEDTVVQSPRTVEETPKTGNDALKQLFEDEEQKLQKNQSSLIGEMTANPRGLGAKLIAMEDVQLASALNVLLNQSPDGSLFLITLIHESGTYATKLLRSLPSLRSTPLNDYLLQKRDFSAMYPMFEGNFSLNDYTTKNKANLPPPGLPPISLEVVQKLEKTLDALLVALRARPCQILAEEGSRIYQIMSYIIAKLKQFKVNTAFLDTTTIPTSQHYHGLLQRAFQMSGLKVSFPAETFNYDDPETQRKLRPPMANAKYQ